MSINLSDEYSELKNKYDIDTYDKQLCFHSVGFDFFKALSILNTGVVSYYNSQVNKIDYTKNFEGNNGEFWISVVNVDSNAEYKEAYDRYVKNGISFLCYVNKLVDGVKESDAETYDPKKPDNYHDEKFVFDNIALSDIQFLALPRHLLDASIKDLQYLYCHSYHEIVTNCVNNYIRHIEQYCNARVKREIIDDTLRELEEQQLAYNILPDDDASELKEAFIEEIHDTKSRLNGMIQKLMQAGFARLLNKKYEDKITLKEVIEYILKRANIEYTIVDDNENISDDFLDSRDLSFYKDEDLYLMRILTFDLNKSNDNKTKTI